MDISSAIMKPKSYRWCIVAMCKNTSISTPEKHFINVPRNPRRREDWFKAVSRYKNPNYPTLTSTLYCCEDHFNMEEDMENYIRFKLMGGYLQSKKHVVPHIFNCQSGRSASKPIPTKAALKMNTNRFDFMTWCSKDTGSEAALDLTMDELARCGAGRAVKSTAGMTSSTAQEGGPIDGTSGPSQLDTVNCGGGVGDPPISLTLNQPDPQHLGHLKLNPQISVRPLPPDNSDDSVRPLAPGTREEGYNLEGDPGDTSPTPGMGTLKQTLPFKPEPPDDSRHSRDSGTAATDGRAALNSHTSDDDDCRDSALQPRTTGAAPQPPGRLPAPSSSPRDDKEPPQPSESRDFEFVAVKPEPYWISDPQDGSPDPWDTFSKDGQAQPAGGVSSPGDFQCSVCHKSLDTKSKLTRHLKVHTRDKPFQCDVCKKPFSHLSTLAIHRRTHTGEKPFQCDVCLKLFTHTANLVTHRRTHTGEKPFECDICKRPFTHVSHLKTHRRTHTGEKPYQCDVCRKPFARMSTLTMHRKTHTGERPHGCDVCGKRFSQVAGLAAHSRTHTGEKPFGCGTCGKRFHQLSGLVTHRRTHTGERPYRCDACGKLFSHLSNLRMHSRTHSGIKPYGCDICPKRFIKMSYLKVHGLTHTGDWRVQCDVCHEHFRSKTRLVKHSRMHTAEKPHSTQMGRKQR